MTWQAAGGYEAAGHQLCLAGSAARAAEAPIAAIVKVAGVTRRAVCNWSAGYGQGHGLTMGTGTHLASLPVQRPRVVKGAPVLILGARNITLTGLPGRWDAAKQQVSRLTAA